MRPVEEHLAECLRVARPLPPIDLPLLDAAGCVLAEDVTAPIDLPRFDNSSMDGYAVHVADLPGAGPQAPLRLPVVADIPAGAGDVVPLAAGNTARIMTGAPLPAGADAVVPVEWTDGGTSSVGIHQVPAPGQFVRRAGEDVRAGQTVLRAGVRLSPRQVSLLAAVGRDRVAVRPRPRVVVISTGSELVPPGRPLGPGQIYDSNGYGLAAAAAELGADVERLGGIPDEPDVVLSALTDAAARADVLITTGGVSAGAYDTVKEVLRGLGTVTFAKVAMQPGMPQGVGTVGPGETPIFTLPGNPVSAQVSFEVFVRPVLRQLRGEDDLHRRARIAVAQEGWASPAGKRQFVRAVHSRAPDGERWLVRPVGGHGSHLVAHLAEATCLAVVPEDVTEVKPGDELRCLILDRVSQ
jgi:molybdopterin molybdotransferase